MYKKSLLQIRFGEGVEEIDSWCITRNNRQSLENLLKFLAQAPSCFPDLFCLIEKGNNFTLYLEKFHGQNLVNTETSLNLEKKLFLLYKLIVITQKVQSCRYYLQQLKLENVYINKLEHTNLYILPYLDTFCEMFSNIHNPHTQYERLSIFALGTFINDLLTEHEKDKLKHLLNTLVTIKPEKRLPSLNYLKQQIKQILDKREFNKVVKFSVVAAKKNQLKFIINNSDIFEKIVLRVESLGNSIICTEMLAKRELFVNHNLIGPLFCSCVGFDPHNRLGLWSCSEFSYWPKFTISSSKKTKYSTEITWHTETSYKYVEFKCPLFQKKVVSGNSIEMPKDIDNFPYEQTLELEIFVHYSNNIVKFVDRIKVDALFVSPPQLLPKTKYLEIPFSSSMHEKTELIYDGNIFSKNNLALVGQKLCYCFNHQDLRLDNNIFYFKYQEYQSKKAEYTVNLQIENFIVKEILPGRVRISWEKFHPIYPQPLSYKIECIYGREIVESLYITHQDIKDHKNYEYRESELGYKVLFPHNLKILEKPCFENEWTFTLTALYKDREIEQRYHTKTQCWLTESQHLAQSISCERAFSFQNCILQIQLREYAIWKRRCEKQFLEIRTIPQCPEFSYHDFDISLLKELQQPIREISKYLLSKLSQNTLKRIKSCENDKDKIKKVLYLTLNELLDKDIYNQKAFAKIQFRSKQYIPQINTNYQTKRHYNRFLLEDVYPQIQNRYVHQYNFINEQQHIDNVWNLEDGFSVRPGESYIYTIYYDSRPIFADKVSIPPFSIKKNIRWQEGSSTYTQIVWDIAIDDFVLPEIEKVEICFTKSGKKSCKTLANSSFQKVVYENLIPGEEYRFYLDIWFANGQSYQRSKIGRTKVYQTSFEITKIDACSFTANWNLSEIIDLVQLVHICLEDQTFEIDPLQNNKHLGELIPQKEYKISFAVQYKTGQIKKLAEEKVLTVPYQTKFAISELTHSSFQISWDLTGIIHAIRTLVFFINDKDEMLLNKSTPKHLTGLIPQTSYSIKLEAIYKSNKIAIIAKEEVETNPFYTNFILKDIQDDLLFLSWDVYPIKLFIKNLILQIKSSYHEKSYPISIGQNDIKIESLLPSEQYKCLLVATYQNDEKGIVAKEIFTTLDPPAIKFDQVKPDLLVVIPFHYAERSYIKYLSCESEGRNIEVKELDYKNNRVFAQIIDNQFAIPNEMKILKYSFYYISSRNKIKAGEYQYTLFGVKQLAKQINVAPPAQTAGILQFRLSMSNFNYYFSTTISTQNNKVICATTKAEINFNFDNDQEGVPIKSKYQIEIVAKTEKIEKKWNIEKWGYAYYPKLTNIFSYVKRDSRHGQVCFNWANFQNKYLKEIRLTRTRPGNLSEVFTNKSRSIYIDNNAGDDFLDSTECHYNIFLQYFHTTRTNSFAIKIRNKEQVIQKEKLEKTRETKIRLETLSEEQNQKKQKIMYLAIDLLVVIIIILLFIINFY